MCLEITSHFKTLLYRNTIQITQLSRNNLHFKTLLYIINTMRQKSTENTTKPTKHPGGRPTKYSPTIQAEICDLIATTPLNDHEIAKKVGIAKAQIYRWSYKHPEFRAQLLQAREARADLHMAGIDDLVTECMDKLDSVDPKKANAYATLLKTKIQVRQAVAGMYNAKYSPRTQLSGPGGGAVEIKLWAGSNKATPRRGGRASRKKDTTAQKSPVKQSLTNKLAKNG